MTISFNPSATGNFGGSFLLTTQGFVQGDVVDDTTARMEIVSGVLASGVALCTGGWALQEVVPSTGEGNLGNNLALSTSTATVSAFSVLTQSYNGIITTGANTAPAFVAGNTINYVRLGSNVRLKVQCSSALVTAAESAQTNLQVAWDFTNQQLIPYASGTALPVRVLAVSAGNSKTISNNAGAGPLTWVNNGNAAIILI